MNGQSKITLLACVLLVAACGGSAQKKSTADGAATALELKGVGGERCDASIKGRDFSEYDTSGDAKPDIRKVMLKIGEGVDARHVMICRETDVDADGRKDVIRYYDDDGRSLREEADRNFDGKMDLAVIFQNGKIVRKEIDENNDGKIDTRIYYENSLPVRAERDMSAGGPETPWRTDRWEYYDEGNMVRMGTDLDGDTRVDRWDRDASRKADEAPAAEAPEPEAGSESSASDPAAVED
jgi:hypothetical protein